MITAAGAAHAAVLAAIHHSAFAGPAAWSEAAIATQLAAPGVFGLVHADGGMVLARAVADEAEILTIAVSPEQRRRGVGVALLRAAHAAIIQRGGRTVFLEVAEANQAARALYVQFGYQPAGRRRAYYEDGADALVLKLSLDPGAAKVR